MGGHQTGLVGRCGLDSSGTREWMVVGSCEHSNKPLGSIKMNFLTS